MTATEPSAEAKAKAWAQLKEHSQSPEQLRARLEHWMRVQLDDHRLEVGPLSTPGGTGIANETLLFDARLSSGAEQGYVARIATDDPLYLDDDLYKHYRMYATMSSISTVPTPGVLGFEADLDVVGSPFFVMEKIAGDIPSDSPSWWTEGFIFDAAPAERRGLWEKTIGLMADFHRLDPEQFSFLRTGVAADGVGDNLDYWIRSLHWAKPAEPVPLTDIAEQWLLDNRPTGSALSWGDSRLPNVIYRDLVPVTMLDWDLVSLAGPQADLAWWITMTAPESQELDGIGTHDEFVDLWEELTGVAAAELRWFMVLAAYRLAAILAKLFSTFVAQGRMPADMARTQLATGNHVQLLAGLLDLTPPAGVTPMVPDVRLDRG